MTRNVDFSAFTLKSDGNGSKVIIYDFTRMGE